MAMKRGYAQSPEHVRKRIEARLKTLKAKPRPVSREWLYRQYVELRRDCVEIGTELNKDPKTIWEWMRFYGIPTRPRGAEASPLFRDLPRIVKTPKRTPLECPGRDWLFREYVDKKRCVREISEELGRGETTVSRWMKAMDIPMRSIRELRELDGRKPWMRNGKHWLAGKKGADTPNWKGGFTPERQQVYASIEWRRAVKAAWAHSKGMCERCGLPYREARKANPQARFHIHHIVGFAVRELRCDPTNLALLCRKCHHFVHGKSNLQKEFIGEVPCQ